MVLVGDAKDKVAILVDDMAGKFQFPTLNYNFFFAKKGKFYTQSCGKIEFADTA